MDPRPCDNNVRNGCLNTLSASQISSVLTLISLLVVFIPVKYTLTGGISKSVNIAVCLGIFYFVIGSWVVEEKYLYELRELKPFWRWIEFIIRVTALTLIPLFFTPWFSSILPKIGISSGFPSNVALMLMALSLLYFLWDIILVMNGKFLKIIHSDFLSFLAASLWLGTGIVQLPPDLHGFLLSIVAILFAIPTISLFFFEKETIRDISKRLLSRNRLR